MSYIGNIADTSPFRVFQTAESLSGGAFTAVELTANGVKTAGASSAVIGILTAETELPIAAGDDVNVLVCGGGLWTTGESIQAGDALTSGANGKAAKAASGKVIFARALESGKANQNVKVLITREGKA